jgi:hypothetical protein
MSPKAWLCPGCGRDVEMLYIVEAVTDRNGHDFERIGPRCLGCIANLRWLARRQVLSAVFTRTRIRELLRAG